MLDIKRLLLHKSDRVKAVDVHPREPWVICSLYSGKVTMHNFETGELMKSFDIVDIPIRSVKFVPRMNWFVCTSDDRMCRVYNYNTMEKIREFETHQDYIRGVAVHESLPYIVTCSDDMTAKLYNWDKNYQNTIMFEGHMHYVMAVTFNPKDPNTFATASLDRTIKVWDVNQWQCNFTLEGHQQGVNAVDYYAGGDKPYLISGSDDRTVKIWDYQTRACVQTLSSHTHNISCVAFFTERPLFISGSEDESIKIWGLQTYRQEGSHDYALGRVWGVATRQGVNKLAIACDQGTVVISIGKEEPVCSMDSNGKVIFAVNNDITQVTIKNNVDEEALDGDKLMLPSKEMGLSEEPPKRLLHNSNGQNVAVLVEGEYAVNSALAWRPKACGRGIDFAWASDANTYAVLETSSTLRIYKNAKVKADVEVFGAATAIFGGALLGVISGGSLCFYDWENQVAVRTIAVQPTAVHWNSTGDLVCIICSKTFYILRYDKEAVAEFFQSGQQLAEDGIEEAFHPLDEIEDQVRRGAWAGDCFLFSNHTQRLNYYMGGEVHNIAVLERPMWLLGYLPKDNRIFLTDKDRNIASYILYQSVIEYQSLVLQGNMELANEKWLDQIPASMKTRVAKFLDQQGYKSKALEVSQEDDHRFDLAMDLHRLELARELAEKGGASSTETKARWKRVGTMALQHAMFDLAAEAFTKAEDYPGLLLLYSSLENKEALQNLQKVATEKRLINIAFSCAHLCGDLESCVTLLCDSGRAAEACLFARSHCPLELPRALTVWKKSLGASRLAEAIADPQEYPNLFPELDGVFKKEEPPAEEEPEKQEEAKPADEELSREELAELDARALPPPSESSPVQTSSPQKAPEGPPVPPPPVPEVPPPAAPAAEPEPPAPAPVEPAAPAPPPAPAPPAPADPLDDDDPFRDDDEDEAAGAPAPAGETKPPPGGDIDWEDDDEIFDEEDAGKKAD